jgi:hypothetical protein
LLAVPAAVKTLAVVVVLVVIAQVHRLRPRRLLR